MKKLKLMNGVILLLENKDTDSVAINVTIKAGSINEEDKNRGISHFIEHMLFEGTKNRTALQIANEIESLGGSIGAYTSSERTCFYVKVLKKHAKIALNVLSDILTNPLFEKNTIKKERTVILSEIKMKKDEPRFYQWSLFQRSIFKKFPLKHPVIGYDKTVKSMTDKDMFEYFNKNYIGANLIVSAVGNITGLEKEIKSAFECIPKRPVPRLILQHDKIRKSKQIIREKKPIKQTYMILGYLAADRKNKDSYVLDVIHAILGRGLSGRLFDELRTKRGLGYDVGCHYEDKKNYGFFAAYATVQKKDLELAKKLILDNLMNVDVLTDKELRDAKRFIEGEFILSNEDNDSLADTLGYYEQVKDAKLLKEYVSKIKKVTVKDIKRVKEKYFGNNYTMVILDQE